LNTLSLASHLLPPWKCRLVNNILRNETGGSLTLATLTLLQNFTGLIMQVWVFAIESTESGSHLAMATLEKFTLGIGQRS
ncbi:MAG TPA: hypothetical protein VMW15_08520, partial [Terracidiphilus sp.]|nr:hypothetical protein [Terracidiphilus sp.]